MVLTNPCQSKMLGFYERSYYLKFGQDTRHFMLLPNVEKTPVFDPRNWYDSWMGAPKPDRVIAMEAELDVESESESEASIEP